MSIFNYPPQNGVLTSLIWRKTAVGGETSLSGYDNASQALSYTPGQEQVFLNGILLVRGADYTATNGTSITGLAALAADDYVQIVCYNNFSLASLPSTSISGTIANNQLQNSSITINGTAVSLGGSTTISIPSAATPTVLGTVYAKTEGPSQDDNVALGYNALAANTDGSPAYSDVAIGYNALASLTGGFDNVAVGYNAASASGYLGAVTAIGTSALQNNTSDDMVAVGAYAFFNSTTGLYGTAVGTAAAEDNLDGDGITAIGYQALRNNTNGDRNTAVGVNALDTNTTGYNNTALGSRAGYLNTGNDNVFVGYNAGDNKGSGDNNIIIGASADSSGNVSNEITIGNTSNNRFRIPGLEIDWQYSLMEKITTSATAATGTINYDLIANKSILYYTSDASGNWTLNLRGNADTTLNSLMSIGQSLTIAFLVTNGATAYYQTALQVDGNAITPKWQGGTAPAAGNVNSIDTYSITIVKTANATFTAFESQTRFA